MDMAGNADLRSRLHHHYGDELRYSCSVGATHWEAARIEGNEPLPGPRPTLFFAPTQVQKRASEWGADGMADRIAAAWTPFVQEADGWITVREKRGAEAVEQVYQEMLSNRASPSDGFILAL